MASSTLASMSTPSSTLIYAPSASTNVTTETTVELNTGMNWNLFKTIVLYFTTTASTGSARSMIALTPTEISAGAYFPIAQGSNVGAIRIGGDGYDKIKIWSQPFNSLYLYRIYGLG